MLREAELEVRQRLASDGKPKKTRWRGEGAGAVSKARWIETGLGVESLGPPLGQAAGIGSCPFSTGMVGTGVHCGLPCGARLPSRSLGRPHPGDLLTWYIAPPVSAQPLLRLQPLLRVPLGDRCGGELVSGTLWPHIYWSDFNQCLCPWDRRSVC